MPYVLRKALGRDKYWVMDENKKRYSKEPMSKEKAEAQRRALYASETLKGKGVFDDLRKQVSKVPKNAITSVKASQEEFLKKVEENTKALFERQASQIDQAKIEAKKAQIAKDKEIADKAKKDLAVLGSEEEKLLALHAEQEKQGEKIGETALVGGGISDSQLAELLTLFSKRSKGKPKNFAKHLTKWIKKELKGGKLRPCPLGMKDNNAGMCVEECKPDEQDFGTWCTKKCPQGETDTGIECIDDKCPDGYTSTLLTCYKPPGGGQCSGGEVIGKKVTWTPITCGGNPLKPVWEPGHWKCSGGPGLEGCPPDYIDDGLTCRKRITCSKIIPAASILKRRTLRATHGKRLESSIDFKGTFEDLKNGMEAGFKELGDELANKFDPEKNGVADAFRKFGNMTKEAFEDIGRKISDFFTKQVGPAMYKAMEDFGNAMASTVGNGDWWKNTMSDPKTYIFIIGTLATVAATVLSAGLLTAPAAGMTVSMAASITALSALGPCMNMIADAANGDEIDVLDIVGLTLSLVPLAGTAAGGRLLFTQMGAKAILAGRLTSPSAIQVAANLAQLGSLAVTGCQIAQTFGKIPKMPIFNKPTGPSGPPKPSDDPERTPCDSELMAYACEYKRPYKWSASCPKPNCEPEDYSYGAKKCKVEKALPATSDKDELYKRAVWKWYENKEKYMKVMPDSIVNDSPEKQAEYEHAYKLDPSKFPSGFRGWDVQFPEPQCWLPNLVSEKTRTCMTQEEYLAEPESIYDLEFGVENEEVERNLEPGDSLDVDVRFLAEQRPDIAQRFSEKFTIPYGATLTDAEGNLIGHTDSVETILNFELMRDFAWKMPAGYAPLVGKKELYERENYHIADLEQELEYMKEDGPEDLTPEQFNQKIYAFENYIMASKSVLKPADQQKTERRLNKLMGEDYALSQYQAPDPTKGANTPEERDRRLKVLEAQELWDDALFKAPSMAGSALPYTPNLYAMSATIGTYGSYWGGGSPFVYLLADPKLGTPLQNLIRREMASIESYSNYNDAKGIGRAVFNKLKISREKLAEATELAYTSGRPWTPNNITARTRPLTDAEATTALFDEEQAKYAAQQAQEQAASQAEQYRIEQLEQAAANASYVNPEAEQARRTQEEIARQQAAARGGSRRCVF